MARPQIRHGTAAAWTSANPVLGAGELGGETDTLKVKMGDGSTPWTGLAYVSEGSAGNRATAYTISAKTDDYTHVAGDAGKLITVTKATAVAFTLDTNANAASAVGAVIDIVNLGAGDLTVAGAGGVTVNSVDGSSIVVEQYCGVRAIKLATNTWLVLRWGSTTA